MKNLLAILFCLFMGITLQAQAQNVRPQEFGLDESLPILDHQAGSACSLYIPDALTETCPVTFEVCKFARSKLPVSLNQLNFVSLYPE